VTAAAEIASIMRMISHMDLGAVSIHVSTAATRANKAR
jgi:hypothetical protein